MSHNDFARPDGQWANEFVIGPQDLRTWDVAQYKSVNGDDGGTWNPAKPITLGGAGLQLTGANHVLSGGLSTASGGRLVHDDSDYITFTGTARSRTLLWPLVSAHIDAAEQGFLDLSTKPVGLRITAPSPLSTVYLSIPKRQLHHGATLSSATLTFYVGQQHAAIPANLPQFQLYRVGVGTSGNTSAALAAAAAVLASPASATAYFNGGAAQTITLTATQNNVIDTTQYTYMLALTDEGGTGALPFNIYASLSLVMGNITDMHAE